jgi:hypothetical protein
MERMLSCFRWAPPLYVLLCFCLFVCLSVCLSVYLSVCPTWNLLKKWEKKTQKCLELPDLASKLIKKLYTPLPPPPSMTVSLFCLVYPPSADSTGCKLLSSSEMYGVGDLDERPWYFFLQMAQVFALILILTYFSLNCHIFLLT